MPHTDHRLRTAVRAVLFASLGPVWIAPVYGASSADGSGSLDEVVVTATRRDQSILDIPYSISAVSGTDLEDSHIQSFSDLTKMIAGLSFVDQGPTSRSNFVLRGINASATDQPSSAIVQPVATYIGETPLFLSLHIDDLDRVEVLRGPQGTLYGSGSLAGTLRFIPKLPDPGAFAAHLDVDGADVAHTNQWNRGVSAMVNLPINDSTAFRATGGFQHYAGFVNENYVVKLAPASTADKSPVGVPLSGTSSDPLSLTGPEVFVPYRHANTADLWHTRLSFLFKPDEKFSALFAYYHQDDRSHAAQAASPSFGGSIDATPANNPYYSPSYPVSFPTGGVVFPHNGPYDLQDSVLPAEHRQADLISADLSYGLGFATLSSSTSAYRDRGEQIGDGTGFIAANPGLYGFLPRAVDYTTLFDQLKGFVEEMRLVSTTGERRFDYVAGLFFQHLQGNNGQTQWVPGQTYFSNLGSGFPGSDAALYGDTNYIVANTTDFLDRALFGEFTYHLTDQWQVTAGARFFKQDFSTNAYSALPYCGTYCGTGAIGSTYSPGGYAANDHISKLNMSYKFDRELNLYAEYAEGFRRGGANGIPLTGPFAVNPALQIYAPDKTKNYEVGAKGSVGGVAYTFDVFYIDWDNVQLETGSYLGGYQIAFNGAKARSRGAELSLQGEFLPHFGYSLGYSYADAQIAKNFTVSDCNQPDCVGGPQPFVTGNSGDRLPNAPQHMATLELNYTHKAPLIPGDWSLRWQANGTYRSSTYSELNNPGFSTPFEIQGFALWSGSVALTNDHGISASLYAENLFDQLGVTGGIDSRRIRDQQYFITRPRTIGLRLGYKF